MNKSILKHCALIVGLLLSPTVIGQSLPSSLKIKMHPAEGEALTVGLVNLTSQAEGWQFQVVWDESKFTEQFLSMRPFKCLQGPNLMLCHLPYPYDNPRFIRRDDLVDLEYDLLFIRKSASEYGINPYHGAYYQLEIKGNMIIGKLHEVDLDILAAPPEDGITRPVGASDLYETDPESHWLPTITIE